MTRAIAYIRVSTGRQDDSLELQTARITAYCTMRGLELCEVIEDETVSGSVPLAQRPAGQHLAEALKRHKATNVIGWRLDRLFRDCSDALIQTKAYSGQIYGQVRADKRGRACPRGGGFRRHR